MLVYYVEDDSGIAGAVQCYLAQQGFTVQILPTAAGARQAMEQKAPDLVLLDWNLPDGQGDALCRWVRTKWPDLPLLFLTVREDVRDVVGGLEAGADDYVTKPFALEVLHSRMRALLRRAGQRQEERLTCGDLVLDRRSMTVFRAGQEIALSQPEYQLLLCLMENKGCTVTRRRLLETIWDSNGHFVNDNTLTVAMKRLREKMHQPPCLKTVRSFGYRMEELP